ncbi:olfactory receptor 2M3-like [Lethenteron reissneri]|uniref:olfactory receptor 2M3-like n=1 Tax=Lethenteron reissneri TaxID=7753 RepID=UPI002AB6D977|nr:olfactory receptor 2M3-like [Lethenteron reissneri]
MEDGPRPNVSAPLLVAVATDLIRIQTVFREPPTVRRFVFAFLLLVYALTLVANSLLCLAIARDRRLHKPMHLLVAALALTDLVENTNALPRTMYDLVGDAPYISVPWCIAKMFTYHVSFRVHGYILAAMAADRYLAVCRPLAYRSAASNAIALKALAFAVALAAAQGLGYVAIAVNLDLCKPRSLLTSTCDFLALRVLSCNHVALGQAYTFAMSLVGIALPLCAIAAFYALVLHECRKPALRRGRNKALRTCGTHLLVAAVYFSAILATFASGAGGGTPSSAASPELSVSLQSLQFVLPPVLNPIVYGLRTAEVKESLVRFLRSRVSPGKPLPPLQEDTRIG